MRNSSGFERSHYCDHISNARSEGAITVVQQRILQRVHACRAPMGPRRWIQPWILHCSDLIHASASP
jgi:hypothetical protein